MRTFLLASAAAVGFAGAAAAQPVVVPADAPPMPMGVMGMPSKPAPYLGGNNMLNSSGALMPDSPAAPVPGSIVIHLQGRVWFYASVNGNGQADSVAGNKISPLGFIGYARLYPGFDGLATNGIRYGGIMEIRQNFFGSVPGASASASIAGSTASSTASGQSSANTLYFRREALYIGSNNIGIFRFGTDDGPISQFEGGVTTFQNFDSGNWNGDTPDYVLGAAAPTWPFWSGIGNEYDIQKAVYMSPQFAGFDFGLSFAPNGTSTQAGQICSFASPGCTTLSSSTAAGDDFRIRNMYEIIGRYQGNFGGFGIYAVGGYVGSGHVNGAGAGTGIPGTPGFSPAANGFSVGDAGLALTYAGFTVGGHVIFGKMNGQVALQPKGGSQAVAWIGGIQYATGPLTVGASWFNYQSQGAANLVGLTQRFENGLHVGGSYAIAPGLVGYAEYSYADKHQGAFNFITGAAGTVAGSGNNNNMHAQAFILGTRVQW